MKKITLRKANALQGSLMDLIKSIEVKNTVVLNEFQNVHDIINTARQTAADNALKREQLLDVAYELRMLVGRANATSGINDLLTRAALLDKKISYLTAMVDNQPTEVIEVLVGKLEKIRSGATDVRRYGYDDTVDTGLYSTVQLVSFNDTLRLLKKEKQSINDKVLELNVRTEIELTKAASELLNKEQLL